ncbi:MAG TPA: hypothetical protein PLB78_03115, partial [Anaerolineae bacterium]|nr:hypothetical protein [Anaerolineae bacterium]
MSVEQRTGECFDAIVIGDLAVDELVVHGETTVATGGSVYYGAVAMARLGMRTAVVTRLAERDFGRLDELRAAGITVYAHAAPESSGIRNVYLTADQDRRICTPLGYAGPFSLAEMPAASARYTVIGPLMAGLVDLDLVRALAARGALALDAQGFLRQRESSYDRTGANRDAVTVPPGGAHALPVLRGPGIIRHIWMTVAPAVPTTYRDLRLVMRFDDAPEPQVD